MSRPKDAFFTVDWPSRVGKVTSALSLFLLVIQCCIPWLCGGSVLTQDGPSHVYNAVVLRELVANPASPYHAIYALYSVPVPNWLSYPVLALLEAVVGPVQAQNLMFCCLVIAVYFGCSYLSAVLSGGALRYSPLFNAAANSWFLYMGFYNFVAGTALALFTVAYGYAHFNKLRPRSYIALSVLFLLIYLSHLLPFAVTLLIVAVYAVIQNRFGAVRTLVVAGLVIAPSLAMAGMYLLSIRSDPTSLGLSWPSGFPNLLKLMMIRLHGGTLWFSGELTLTPLLLTYGLLFIMSPPPLTGCQKVLVVIFPTFLLAALVMPREATTNNFAGERLLWISLLLIMILVVSVKAHLVRSAIEVVAFVLVLLGVAHYIIECRQAIRELRPYLETAATMSRNSVFVRVLEIESADIPNSVPLAHAKLIFDPLLHAEDGPAAEHRLLNVSNYEPTKGYFPICYRKDLVSPAHQELLHSFEFGCDEANLKAIASLPITVRYALVLYAAPRLRELKTCLATGGFEAPKGSAESGSSLLFSHK
jgi:hypothetical protein